MSDNRNLTLQQILAKKSKLTDPKLGRKDLN